MKQPRALWLGLLLLSCMPDNGLSGSMSEVFPLDVSRTEIARNDEAIQITYLFNRGVFLDVVVRVSVLMRGVDFKYGRSISLVGADATGELRCVVTHAPGGESVRDLPPISKGDLIIDEGGQPGEITRGNFSMAFQNTGGDVGFGRTLVGTFLGTASDAGFGELP
jgi:hypothetical protein